MTNIENPCLRHIVDQFAKEAVAIGILIEFDKVEPDGGWIVMIGDRIETFVTTWWDCEVVDEDR